MCIPRSKNGLDFSKLLTRGGVLLIRVKSHNVDAPTSCESEKSLALQNCIRLSLTILDCFGRFVAVFGLAKVPLNRF